mgnify:CR=1 FL=1
MSDYIFLESTCISPTFAADVHVLVASLAGFDVDSSLASLTPAETERASMIRHAKRRAQFVRGRSLLRTALQDWPGCRATGWEVVLESGVPIVRGAGAPSVSLAHSEDIVICAVANHPVGVDVEYRRDRDYDALAAAICSQREWLDYEAQVEAKRVERFYALWVLKEALFKCFRPMTVADVPEISFGQQILCAGAALKLFKPAAGYEGGVALSASAPMRLELKHVDE